MSLEIAKKVLSEVNVDDNIWNSEAEIEKILKEREYNCTLDELKKAHILANSLSEEELDKVTGGNGKLFDRSNCSGDYFVETCTDTVESGSGCFSGDRNCLGTNIVYHCTDSALHKGKPIVHVGPNTIIIKKETDDYCDI